MRQNKMTSSHGFAVEGYFIIFFLLSYSAVVIAPGGREDEE
jgi:hypothetical protein